MIAPCLLALLVCGQAFSQTAKESGQMVFNMPAGAHFRFDGEMGHRAEANVDDWLLRAPVANPGMLEMFRKRDRQWIGDIMPWAGEFAGKYLISAVQAVRMTGDARLRPFVADFIRELIATQADDGYLGPFRKDERLLSHWDLWGHYHVMLGLMMWYEDTGDQAALDCAARAGDLVCNTFLGTDKRVFDVGTPETNMSIGTAMLRLYRHTGQERYRQMASEVEQDWERRGAGDYLRTGLAAVDYYRTPRPRWESLHSLQQLTESFEITGDERYRKAFVQHWTTIRDYDRHPSGGFTTGEQAVGNPYGDGAIETCCTTAWMALTVDMLRLTGDPEAADELELATWNSMLGSQHPSGRWWTYNTPVNGVREASAHTIVFQSRCGTPELNCCSVNAPRGLGMLSEWSVMLDAAGPVVNYYGPGESVLKLADGTGLTLTQTTTYPADGHIRLTVAPEREATFNLRLRIPAWSKTTSVTLNGAPVAGAVAGSYLSINRAWHSGDVVELSLDMSLRYWSGEMWKSGTAALYRGPLLLSYDQKLNALEPDQAPTFDLAALASEPLSPPATNLQFQPLVLLKLKATDGQEVTLCDFATAGASGTIYRSWLPAVNGAPAPFYLKQPASGATVPAGALVFEWSGYRPVAGVERTFTLEVAADADFTQPLLRREGLEGTKLVIEEGLPQEGTCYWRVSATNEHGVTVAENGPWAFTIDPTLPAAVIVPEPVLVLGEGGLMIASPLDGSGAPTFGTLETEADVVPAEDRFGTAGGAVAFNGQTSTITYSLPCFPEEDYTVSIWLCPEGEPQNRNQQVFSAWSLPMDDPLRIVIVGDEVAAAIEGGAGARTPGVRLARGEWVHLAAVKEGPQLRLYVNGELKQTSGAPVSLLTSARNVAVGTNPNLGGSETLLGKLDDFRAWARALSSEEISGVFGSNSR